MDYSQNSASYSGERHSRLSDSGRRRRSSRNTERYTGGNSSYGEHRTSQRRPRRNLMAMLFFPGALLYHELILDIGNKEAPFFAASLPRIILFAIAAGILVGLILDLIPSRKASRIAGGIIVGLWCVLTCIQYCCKSFYKTYFSLSMIIGMTGQVVGDFFSTLVDVVVHRIPFILLAMLPLAAFILLRERIIPRRQLRWRPRVLLCAVMIVAQLGGFLLSRFGADSSFYTYDFSTNASIPQFGLPTCVRLEAKYGIFGMPEVPLEPVAVDKDSEGEKIDPTLTPIEYDFNVMDIDFDKLASQTSDKTLQNMHQYFAGKTPSQQNEFTGLFEGKNLILITAESFSPYAVISEELTPTLYKLTHSGIVCTDFYQPGWTQSTTGGEFSVMTGVIPTWIGSSLSMRVSAKDYMPLVLGNQFRKLGYSTPAWHNNTYTYYGRDETHPNLGYDYVGIGNGLVMESKAWPRSDLEMFQLTLPGCIEDYVQNGKNFHSYYMSVSGHCIYTWGGNAMARKWKDTITAAFPDMPEQCQAYMAANMEFEAAMTYMVEALEEAGIADDTVICVCSDHYPYALAEGDVDYYNMFSHLNDNDQMTTRYKQPLILWSGCIEEPIVVDIPCSSIDIVPTLSNLFGLEYDSRLLSGRDIFAQNYKVTEASSCMPLVVFANTGYGNSWISAAGTYEAYTKTFTPKEGVTVSDDYIKAVSRIAANKYNYSKLLIEKNYYKTVLK